MTGSAHQPRRRHPDFATDMLADDDLGGDRCAFESERLAQPATIGDAPNIFERRFRLCLVSPFLATRLKSDPGMTMNLDPTQQARACRPLQVRRTGGHSVAATFDQTSARPANGLCAASRCRRACAAFVIG